MVCSIADKAERENDSAVGSWGTTLRVWLEKGRQVGSVWIFGILRYTQDDGKSGQRQEQRQRQGRGCGWDEVGVEKRISPLRCSR